MTTGTKIIPANKTADLPEGDLLKAVANDGKTIGYFVVVNRSVVMVQDAVSELLHQDGNYAQQWAQVNKITIQRVAL